MICTVCQLCTITSFSFFLSSSISLCFLPLFRLHATPEWPFPVGLTERSLCMRAHRSSSLLDASSAVTFLKKSEKAIPCLTLFSLYPPPLDRIERSTSRASVIARRSRHAVSRRHGVAQQVGWSLVPLLFLFFSLFPTCCVILSLALRCTFNQIAATLCRNVLSFGVMCAFGWVRIY